MSQDWIIFHGEREPHNGIDRLLQIAAPKWRQFADLDPVLGAEKDEAYWTKLHNIAKKRARDIERGQSFRIPPTQSEPDNSDAKQPSVIDAVNAALYLRRPLLITGKPGSGKTSLAYAISYELKLGPVLVWSVTLPPAPGANR